MTLYARSDVVCVSLGARGCGATHTRPVTHGAPAKQFKLDCPPCEAVLKGSRRGVIQSPISKTGPLAMGVIDADPAWSSSPDTVPLTPDEERTDATRRERGKAQIEMLQALAAIRATGVNIPVEALYLLENELPAGILKGTMLCANGHDNPAGLKFCGECGTGMAARAAIGGSDDSEPAVDLARLHPQTLRKMCRDRDLPDKGSKDDLIARLAA